MKAFIKKFFKEMFGWLGDRFENIIKWLNDELYNWLPKFLKGLGFGGLAALIYDTFEDAVDDTLDRFSFFARLFKIDTVFDKINEAWTPYLSDTLNTDFIGVCNSFGIIASINELINCISWTMIIWVCIFVINNIFKFVAGALVVGPK